MGPAMPYLEVASAPPLDGQHTGVWLTAPRVESVCRIDRQSADRPPAPNLDLRLLSADGVLYVSAAMTDDQLQMPEQRQRIAGGELRTGGDVFELFVWPAHQSPLVYAEIHVYPDGSGWQALHLDRKQNPHPWEVQLQTRSRVQQVEAGVRWVAQLALPLAAVARADAGPPPATPDFRVLASWVDVDQAAGAPEPSTTYVATAPLTVLWFHLLEQYGRLIPHPSR